MSYKDLAPRDATIAPSVILLTQPPPSSEGGGKRRRKPLFVYVGVVDFSVTISRSSDLCHRAKP